MPVPRADHRGSIHVRYFAVLRDLAGRKEDHLELAGGATVREVMLRLVELRGVRFKEFLLTTDGKLRPGLTVLVNGEAVDHTTLDHAPVPDGSEVVIMPPVGGG